MSTQQLADVLIDTAQRVRVAVQLSDEAWATFVELILSLNRRERATTIDPFEWGRACDSSMQLRATYPTPVAACLAQLTEHFRDHDYTEQNARVVAQLPWIAVQVHSIFVMYASTAPLRPAERPRNRNTLEVPHCVLTPDIPEFHAFFDACAGGPKRWPRPIHAFTLGRTQAARDVRDGYPLRWYCAQARDWAHDPASPEFTAFLNRAQRIAVALRAFAEELPTLLRWRVDVAAPFDTDLRTTRREAARWVAACRALGVA